MKRYVYLNGSIVPEAKACVSVFDRGLNYGDGLFETMKARDGEVFFLREHIRRLRQGARALDINAMGLLSLIKDIDSGTLKTLLAKNGLEKGLSYIKIIITRGVETGGHLPSKGVPPTSIIVCKPLNMETIGRYREEGMSAVIIEGMGPQVPGAKSLNYLSNVLGRVKAAKMKADEAIFSGHGSMLLEGTSTNLFIIRKDVISTPPLTLNEGPAIILPGVIRAAVIKQARKKGLEVREEPVYIKDLEAAQEAFLTNSIIDVAPLVNVSGRPVGGGRPGPVTRLLQGIFK